jgi:hypothetical protein
VSGRLGLEQNIGLWADGRDCDLSSITLELVRLLTRRALESEA